MVCYHCARSYLDLYVTRLFDYWYVGVGLGCGLVDSCTCHISYTPFRVPSRNIFPFLTTVICVAVNVDVHISSHSYPMYISTSNWIWGKMCDVLSLVDNKGFRFSSTLWVAFVRLPYGGSN